jgi:hypothetical protein
LAPGGGTWGMADVLYGNPQAPEGSDLVSRVRCSQVRLSGPCLLLWTPGQGDHSRLDGRHGRMGVPSHLHTTLIVAGVRVHVDHVSDQGGGTAYGFVVVHVYEGPRLRTRAVRFGCSLGGGGDTFPATARLRNGWGVELTADLSTAVLFRPANSPKRLPTECPFPGRRSCFKREQEPMTRDRRAARKFFSEI